MEINKVHAFELERREIPRLQKRLRGKLCFTPLRGELQTVAGCDVSFCKKRNLLFGCIVVVRYPEWEILELCLHKTASVFPYIPGMLSFRELPVLLKMFRKINFSPGLVLVDGQGISHPRGLGLASHLGLFIDIPTIGVAKKKLCGTYNEDELSEGDWLPLKDNGKQVGYAIRRKAHYRPLFVSPGNNIDLNSVKYLMEIIFDRSPYKQPHPLYLAHKFSYKFNQHSR